ncbi:DUF3618 domain-containing protein [Actinophytocola gossypii]|uniref:DUF3618 domain-containing protein n=1 Tax=Actinophytocola gossypii TaxID=2812003 RepID=A0ABT2JA17_9PSEU|nr:DUF3618 domain-containing protein [Actinophytocola gossypii]MCT2584697.1 DUF3618 domain-containing protein [Actinophytocola gossypii]
MTVPNDAYSDDPDRLRRDIEHTQRNLSTDVDMLTDKVSPGRIVHRRVGRARRAVHSMRDRVMGTASSGMSSASDGMSHAGHRVGDAASSATSSAREGAANVAETVRETPQAVRHGTEGNPLAAGLIAFGAGWLLSSLVPPSQAEQHLAEQAKEKAQEHGVTEHMSHAAEQVKENLREPAQHAVDSVKSTASDAAGTVQDEARHATGDVTDRAQQARTNVQER